MVRCICTLCTECGTTTQGSPNKNLARTLGARILPWHMPWRIPWATHSLEWLRNIGEILIDRGSPYGTIPGVGGASQVAVL